MEKTKPSKKKIIISAILICCAVAILVYDTYQIHFSDKKSDLASNLTIEYENAGNILLENITNNSSISLKIKVKNETDHMINYKIAFRDVVNPLNYKPSVTYTFSKERGNIEIHSDIFPSENVIVNDGDKIEPGETLDYVITVRTNSMESTDFNKSIQARILLIEDEV